MKKLIYILFLLPFLASGQVSNGTEFEQEAFKSSNPQTVTTTDYIQSQGADGTGGRILPENIPVNISPQPINYSITDTKLGSHLKGIDNKFGSLVQTTAGITNRIWFTGDISVVNAVNYFTSNAQSKGVVTAASPTPLVNNDNVKQYFTQDIIGNAFPSIQKFPAGTYAGNLSVRVSPNSAQQRYTVEIYKTNNLGTPIASGISGAPIGDLGVAVVSILDSGIINLADNSVTNIPVTGILASELTINATERIRYHVSAAKVGTAGASITMEVFYGSSYNSYYDVPVTFNTTLQQSYNNSLVPQITTTTPLGAVTIKRGSASDTNNILVGQNGGGTNTFSVNGDGNITATSFIKSSAPTTNLLLAGGTDIPQSTFALAASAHNPVTIGTANGLSLSTQVLSLGLASTSTTGALSSTDWNTFNNKQTALTNPVTGTGANGQVAFWNGTSTQTGNNSLFWDNTNKRLGIGTDVPTAKLHLVGGSQLSNTIQQTYSGVSASRISIASNGSLRIGLDLVDGSTDRITVLTNGNVGIGTTAPSEKLHVVGNILASGTITASPAVTSTQVVVKSQLDAVGRPYKVYTALLSQSGTGAPVATVLENSLGGTVVWTRTSTGDYLGTLSGVFTANKTAVTVSQSAFTGSAWVDINTSTVNAVHLVSNLFAGSSSDGLMNKSKIEIVVYP